MVPSIDRCPHCKRKFKRSNESNKRYWALLHRVAEQLKPGGESYSADSYHLWAKSKFLGCEDHTLPSGKTLTIPRSTASLDTAEFNNYMTAVEAWANERGVFLEDADG